MFLGYFYDFVFKFSDKNIVYVLEVGWIVSVWNYIYNYIFLVVYKLILII